MTLGSLWGGGQGRRGGQCAPRSDPRAGLDTARSIRLAPVHRVPPPHPSSRDTDPTSLNKDRGKLAGAVDLKLSSEALLHGLHALHDGER